jgi:hypothetical protein
MESTKYNGVSAFIDNTINYELCMKGDTFVHIKETTPIKCIIEE